MRRDSTPRFVGPSVRPSVLTFSEFMGFWLYFSFSNAPLTSIMAPAHPHATGGAVYPALLMTTTGKACVNCGNSYRSPPRKNLSRKGQTRSCANWINFLQIHSFIALWLICLKTIIRSWLSLFWFWQNLDDCTFEIFSCFFFLFTCYAALRVRIQHLITINDLGQTSSKICLQFSKRTIKTFSNGKKLPIFLEDLKSMTNHLSCETNPGVLDQFVEKWHTVKDSYFQVQLGVKKWKKIDEVRNRLCSSQICGV